MTDPVLSVTSNGTVDTTLKTGGSATLDKDAFLKLMVAQLKYQNPMAPADSNAMMAQSAQFTMVESLQEISKTQSDASAWQRVVAGQGLIGKQVTGSVGDTTVTGVAVGMTITADGPILKLADGSTLPVGAVTSVATAPAATSPTAPAAAAPAAPSTSDHPASG